MLKVFQEERRVMAYFDLHGHSRKKNAFMYGCEYSGNDSRHTNFLLRSLPGLFGCLNSIFKFSNCSFKLEKSKEKTGRVVCFKELGIMHSFTLETSFYGRERIESDPADADLHMNTSDFMQLGEDLAKTIWHYQNENFITALNEESFLLAPSKEPTFAFPPNFLPTVRNSLWPKAQISESEGAYYNIEIER
jgi:hypothetical protein